MADEKLRALERRYQTSGTSEDRKALVRALRQTGNADGLIALYEPLLVADKNEREEYVAESYIRPEHARCLQRILDLHDKAGLATYMTGPALERQDYEHIDLLCDAASIEQAAMLKCLSRFASTRPQQSKITFEDDTLPPAYFEKLITTRLHDPNNTHVAIDGTPLRVTYHDFFEFSTPDGRLMRL